MEDKVGKDILQWRGSRRVGIGGSWQIGNRRARGVFVGVATLLAFCLAACSSSSGDASGGSNGNSNIPTVTIGLPFVDPDYSIYYIPLIEKDFESVGVNVKIAMTTNPLPDLVSGRINLVGFSPPLAINGINSGSPSLKVIYNNANGGSASYIAAVPSVKELSQCTRLGSAIQGSAGYAWAGYLKQKLNYSYQLAPESPSTVIAELGSGQLDCAIYTYGQLEPLVAAGKAHFILNPEDPSTYPPGFNKSIFDAVSNASLIGLDSWLKANRETVVKVIQGIQKGMPTVLGDPNKVANLLKENSDWSGLSATTIANEVKHLQPFLYPDQGYYPNDSWPTELDMLEASGSTFISTDPDKYSYSSVVDMSYYDAATKQ
jgi:ABC-type nitrate/sulfonate/bicarbonate transport system substrate-binding protein